MKKYYSALGEFTHVFAQAEAIMQLAFHRIADIPPAKALILKKDMKLDKMMEVTKALLPLSTLDDEGKNDMAAAIGQLEHIAAFRNRVIHRGARQEDDGTFRATNSATAKSRETVEVVAFTLEHVHGATYDLCRIVMTVSVYLSELLGEMSEEINRHHQMMRGPWLYKPVQPRTPNSPPRAKLPPRGRPPKASPA